MNNILTKLNKRKTTNFGGSIKIFLLFLIVFLIIIFVLAFFRVKSIYSNILIGRDNLNKALSYVGEGYFNEASTSAQEASLNFSSVSSSLDKIQNNIFFKKVKFINSNIRDFKYLAQTAEVLSRSASKSLFLIRDLEDLVAGNKASNFSEFSPEEKTLFLKTLYESYPEMNGIKANINLALVYLNQVGDNKILSSYSDKINLFRDQLTDISLAIEKVVSLSGIIPVLTGYPDPANYLIVLQNNNELRPTGGFIGTYGILEINLGDIKKLETYDIYHLDMPASLNKDFKVEPPLALKKYLGVDHWFMRDANWSPDWPTSAKKLQWFYNEEALLSKGQSEVTNFSGVIAITPRLITDLLYIVGPIEISGQVYDKDNFIDILQYEVEMAFREDGISEWDRKLVIGEILKELKLRLFNLPSDRWMELVELFVKNIDEKNILVYLNDDYSRKVSSDLNWGGEVREADLDYLMVVDANLAAFKTDRVMEKKIKYTLEEVGDQFKARVEIIYKNNGWFDWQTTRYRTFTRVYTPLDSALVKSSGISSGEVVSSVDKEIYYPKSYFGGFISIEPGKTGTLVFEYILPKNIADKIKEEKIYSLDLQKQAGNNVSEFEANFNFSRPITEVKAWGDYEVDGNTLKWKNSLERDSYLEVKF